MNNFNSFDEVIRAYLDKKDAARSKDRDHDWWYASELGMCLRKSFMRRLGLANTEEKEFRIRMVAEDGNAGHAWRQEAAESMGVVIETEGPLRDNKLKYKGRFDLLIRLGDTLSIVDIKTQRPEAFFRRAKKPIGERVEEWQKMQLASYLYFARKKYPDLEIKNARIYYVDRGGGVREEYIFYFKQNMFDNIVGELELLNKFWETKQYPPKDERKWVCRYCPYKTICTKVEKDNLTVNQAQEQYGSKEIKNSKGTDSPKRASRKASAARIVSSVPASNSKDSS